MVCGSLTSASDHHSSSLAGSVPLKKSTTACLLVIRKALVSGISLAATCRGLQSDADCTACWDFEWERGGREKGGGVGIGLY